jgi:hypothetical protein
MRGEVRDVDGIDLPADLYPLGALTMDVFPRWKVSTRATRPPAAATARWKRGLAREPYSPSGTSAAKCPDPAARAKLIERRRIVPG